MKYVNTIFNQVLDLIPKIKFQSFVGQHNGDRYVKKLSCWNQLCIMLFAQAKGKNSLREIEETLNAQSNKLYHLGIKTVAKSTIADANKNRSYKIFESLFYELLGTCKELLPRKTFNFENRLYALDSTTIKLCLKLFPWATYKEKKGALKLHCLLDVRTQIPEFIIDSVGRANDLAEARNANFHVSPDSIYVMDRAYVDFKWLYESFHLKKAFFVMILKKNINYFVLEEENIQEKGVLKDQKIVLCGQDTIENYPEDTRLVTYYDEKTKKTYQFLTNNFELSAKTIADIYRLRWSIELFFKWIKQNLKIKTFLGTSRNAVLTQIWIAMIYYLIVNYIKLKANVKASLTSLTRILKEVLMDRVPFIDILGLRLNQLGKLKIRGDTQLALL